MDQDAIQAGNQWLSAAEYDLIRARVPVLCVDVLLSPAREAQKVGLIKRGTPDGDKWWLVGGRVLRNEPLHAAVGRHVAATLGRAVRLDCATLVLADVIEYFTEPGIGPFRDPRKHSVALTYACECTGDPEPLGEALEFGWFDISELPDVDIGFGGVAVMGRVLASLGRLGHPLAG
jgi:ADP-ribose pyrophosphatase YjhB (NUDIX family)